MSLMRTLRNLSPSRKKSVKKIDTENADEYRNSEKSGKSDRVFLNSELNGDNVSTNKKNKKVTRNETFTQKDDKGKKSNFHTFTRKKGKKLITTFKNVFEKS